MKRRDFIKNTAVGGLSAAAVGGLGGWFLRENGSVNLTILHTNDVHSRIDPFPASDSRYPGMGGYAKRAALIKKIRQEEEHVLLFDSGDIFQGTPYFNYYGGELDLKLMSDMGYDASTFGNHDFDNGIDGLVKQLPHASFPFINSNYILNDTPLAGSTLKHQVFEKGGIRIGVFGLGIELEGLVHPKLYGDVRYTDPIAAANREASFLRNEMNCGLIIGLSHLGFDYDREKYGYNADKVCDKHVAENSQNVDILLGGHTHDFLDEPRHFKNMDGQNVMVCQVGWAGIKLGRIDLNIDIVTKSIRSHYIASKVS